MQFGGSTSIEISHRSALTSSTASSGRTSAIFSSIGSSSEKSIFGASAGVFSMDEGKSRNSNDLNRNL